MIVYKCAKVLTPVSNHSFVFAMRHRMVSYFGLPDDGHGQWPWKIVAFSLPIQVFTIQVFPCNKIVVVLTFAIWIGKAVSTCKQGLFWAEDAGNTVLYLITL